MIVALRPVYRNPRTITRGQFDLVSLWVGSLVICTIGRTDTNKGFRPNFDQVEEIRIKKRVSERVLPRVSDWIICMTLGKTHACI